MFLWRLFLVLLRYLSFLLDETWILVLFLFQSQRHLLLFLMVWLLGSCFRCSFSNCRGLSRWHRNISCAKIFSRDPQQLSPLIDLLGHCWSKPFHHPVIDATKCHHLRKVIRLVKEKVEVMGEAICINFWCPFHSELANQIFIPDVSFLIQILSYRPRHSLFQVVRPQLKGSILFGWVCHVDSTDCLSFKSIYLWILCDPKKWTKKQRHIHDFLMLWCFWPGPGPLYGGGEMSCQLGTIPPFHLYTFFVCFCHGAFCVIQMVDTIYHCGVGNEIGQSN